MNDIIAMANALRAVLAAQPLSEPASQVAGSVLTCARGLVSAGEPMEALLLLDAAGRLDSELDSPWKLRMGIARLVSLRQARQFDAAILLQERLSTEHKHILPSLHDESIELRLERGATLWRLNRVDESLVTLHQLHKELLLLPDCELSAKCSFHLSMSYYFKGDFGQARAYAFDSLVSARRCGSRMYELIALENIGRVERMAGRWASAEEYGQQALEIGRAKGYRVSMIISERCLAIIDWKRGRLASALSKAENSRVSAVQLGNGYEEWFSSLMIGMAQLHAGDYVRAASCFSAETDWLLPRASSRASLLTTEFLGDIHLEQEQAAEALKHYDEVWPKTLALVPKGDIVAELRRRRAECYLLLGHLAEAYEEAKTGIEHCRELGDRYEEAATYRVMALAAAAMGKPAEAKSCFDQGFAYYEDIETPFEWGKLWMSYGDWLAGKNAGEFADTRAALDAYRAAEDHFERMGAEGKLAMVRTRLDALIAALGPEGANLVGPSPLRDKLRAPRRPRLAQEIERRAAWALETFGMVTRNRGVLDVLAQCAKLAEGTSPILVLGESGTGKELIAAAVHKLSGRNGNYLPINCAAIPHDVFESELFGHVNGAFTGATRDKAGIFEVCDAGTVFLDEIGEMPVDLQARILRYLESGEFRRVGATRNTRSDTRLIAATNRERGSLRAGHGFRTDLYYRLAHGVITLPPLRQRGDDIELLLEFFVDKYSAEFKKKFVLSDDAWLKLVEHPWPGNIRELKSTVQRIALLSTPGVAIETDAIELDDTDVPTNLAEETILVEKRRIEDAIREASGNKSEAARLLGLSRTTMLSKMKRYGIG